MSIWSVKRKIIIQLFIFSFLSIFLTIFIFFYLQEEQTCFDGIQNQNEVDVDCGGICERECKFYKSVNTLWERFFWIDEGIYSAVALVENNNTDLYTDSVNFEFNFYDEEGLFIKRSAGNTPIMPGGITAVYVPYIVTENRKISNISFDLVGDPEWVNKRKYTFLYSDFSYNYDPKNIEETRLEVKAENKSGINLRNIDFIAIVYDDDDNAISASRTYFKEINEGRILDLVFTWINPPVLNEVPCDIGVGECTSKPTRYEIIAVDAINL